MPYWNSPSTIAGTASSDACLSSGANFMSPSAKARNPLVSRITANPWFDVAELLFDGAADAGRLFAQATKFAERFEPGLVFTSLNAQLFRQRF